MMPEPFEGKELHKIISYEQTREKFRYPPDSNNDEKKECYIEITKDIVKEIKSYKNSDEKKFKDKKFFFAEFEVRGGNILERRQMIDSFWRKVKEFFPNIEDKVCYKTKLDICLELGEDAK